MMVITKFFALKVNYYLRSPCSIDQDVRIHSFISKNIVWCWLWQLQSAPQGLGPNGESKGLDHERFLGYQYIYIDYHFVDSIDLIFSLLWQTKSSQARFMKLLVVSMGDLELSLPFQYIIWLVFSLTTWISTNSITQW